MYIIACTLSDFRSLLNIFFKLLSNFAKNSIFFLVPKSRFQNKIIFQQQDAKPGKVLQIPILHECL
jgi:hypothetical protein